MVWGMGMMNRPSDAALYWGMAVILAVVMTNGKRADLNVGDRQGSEQQDPHARTARGTPERTGFSG
jgi:hypothetical protein